MNPKYCCEVEPDNLPDLVAVVRCKDCKHGKPQMGEIYCEAHEEIGYDPEPTHPLCWFCADGEPKDGDKE